MYTITYNSEYHISTSMPYTVDVCIKHGQLQTLMDWCEENCRDEWLFGLGEFTIVNFDNCWRFEFDSESDYLLFVLTWI